MTAAKPQADVDVPEYADGHDPATYSEDDVKAQRGDAVEPDVEPDPPEVIGGPGDADATPEELAAAAAPPVVPDPYDGHEPEQWGYCHNDECDVNAQQLWHPVGQPGPDTAADEFGRPHVCTDFSHPHPVMCQCGDLLQAEPPQGQPNAADTLVEQT